MPAIATDVTLRGLSVCSSVTLMHPDNVVRRNDTPSGTETLLAPSNIVLDRGSGIHVVQGKWKFKGSKPQSKMHCKWRTNRHTYDTVSA